MSDEADVFCVSVACPVEPFVPRVYHYRFTGQTCVIIGDDMWLAVIDIVELSREFEPSRRALNAYYEWFGWPAHDAEE